MERRSGERRRDGARLTRGGASRDVRREADSGDCGAESTFYIVYETNTSLISSSSLGSQI